MCQIFIKIGGGQEHCWLISYGMTLIRPVVEYASPAWNPFYRKDIDELEKVQKRALKLSRTPIKSVPLEQSQRRLEVDLLCEVYKYILSFLLTYCKVSLQKRFSI